MKISSFEQPLPDGATLAVYNNDNLIFTSSASWLHPLFDLEKFFASYSGPCHDLSAHDKAVGKAAAALLVRLGIRHIHTELASSLAVRFLDEAGIPITYDKKVERILCATEGLLADVDDIKEIYSILRMRMETVSGTQPGKP
jgi:zinc transport system ATP-binding protein